MKRYVNLEDISDGKLYDINDMVKADCNDCKGCHECCTGMGSSITLTPIDIFNICSNENTSIEELLKTSIELNVVDGMILPNIKMSDKNSCCSFLNQEGRCSIHTYRPGICRLFPLGRFYEDGSFKYFLQIHECDRAGKTKVKVKKWIDTPDIISNEKYINDWHNLLNNVECIIAGSDDETFIRNLNMYILNTFYMTSYDYNEDFYNQFNDRLMKARDMGIEAN